MKNFEQVFEFSSEPLPLLALGLLAGASRAQADRGASAWFLNLSGEDREVIYNRDKVPGTLSLDVIDPATGEAGADAIEITTGSLGFLGGCQHVVLAHGASLELYLDHDATCTRARFPFWVGNPGEHGKDLYTAFEFVSDQGGAAPAARIRPCHESAGQEPWFMFGPQDAKDQLELYSLEPAAEDEPSQDSKSALPPG